MLFKLAILTLAITATLCEDKAFDACTITPGDIEGVLGYDFEVKAAENKIEIGDSLSCKEYEIQACNTLFGDLAADAAQTTATKDSDIVSYCTIEGTNLEVNVQQFAWNENGKKCQFGYAFRGGFVPTGSISDSDANLQAWYSHANTTLIDVTPASHSHTVDGTTISGNRWQKSYPLSEIVAGTTIFQDNGSNTTSYIFKAQFSYSIFSNAQEQLVYAFDVQLTINRATEATEDLSVTKTLVAGQCCKNSLGAESKIRFCPDDNQWCDDSNDIETIPRNTEFYVQHYLDTSDADTNTLSTLYNLYPDEIKIGPFYPIWSTTANAWYQPAPVSIYGNSIKIQSNVAFAATVSVASRLWDKNVALPHDCFYTADGYKKLNGDSCDTAAPNTRRFLQAGKSGQADTQMSSSKGLVFTDDGSDQKDTNTDKKKSSDDDNTVLIAVVVSLVVVLAIGGIVGGIYYCKSKNQKQENNYNNDVKNVQQQQQA